MSHKRSSGFTLIEIMVVVGIIAVLAAVSVPNLIAYRKTSHAKACKNNIRLIMSACRATEIKTGKIETDLDKLVGKAGGGFLKWKPLCPVGGKYEISVDPVTEELTVTCTADDEVEHDVSH